jgi:hypothetical protein
MNIKIVTKPTLKELKSPRTKLKLIYRKGKDENLKSNLDSYKSIDYVI